MDVKTIRKDLIEYFGKDWWMEVLDWLKENVDFPNTYPLPEHMADDFHEVFRNKVCSIFKITNETSAANRLTAYSRMKLLKHMRPSLLPHYAGILCPVFRSRSINNFGLVSMKVERGDIFSRAFYNLPFPFDQKAKRTVISCYGIAKHGRKIDDAAKYPDGGVFLLNPDKDEQYEKFAKYTDYAYVTLNWRFPKNYDEFIKTLDGSVLISKSAAKKLRYKKIAYAIIANPAKEISEKLFGIVSKKIPKEGVRIEYQQQLTDEDSDLSRLSSAVGEIKEVKLLTPQVEEPERRVWWIRIEDERDAEIGCKLESPCGLKHTISGYTDDKEPTIVINPDTFKDRAIWREIKETGHIHCYPTIPGMDGNISTRNIRISRTLVQGIFCYPPKVREELIKAVFNKKNLVFPFPSNILNILEKMPKVDVDKLAKKYPEFSNYLFYTRRKEVKGQEYFYVEPTRLYRAWKKLNKVKDYNKLTRFEKESIDNFVRQIVKSLLLFDSEKKCKIKIRGYIRIILFHSSPDINEIQIGRSLWKQLGEPEYVLFAKEPVTRDLSIRCLRVRVKSDEECPPWVCRIHPFLAMDHENPTPETFHSKIDCQPAYAPILVREDGVIKWLTFGELWEEYADDVMFDGEKWIANLKESLEVRTSQGWQPIKYLVRKKAKYNLYRVLSTEYWSECSAEHRFLVNREKVSPNDMIGKKFDIDIPEFEEKFDLDKDVAWFYGFFAAEGTIVPGKTIRVFNKDSDLIDRCITALQKLNLEYHIGNYRGVKYISIKPLNIAKDWQKLFYSGKEKKLPDFIFYSTRATLEAVLSGLIDGDGHVYENGKIIFTTKSSLLAQQVVWILKRLGYTYFVNVRKDKPRIIQITTVPTNGVYENPNRGYPDEIRLKALELKAMGYKQREIAKILKVGEATISRWINNGIERSTKTKFIEERDIVRKIQKLPEEEYVYSLSTPTGDYYDVFILHKQTDGDLAILIPLEKPIEGAMYPPSLRKYNKLWNENKNVALDTVKHFDGYKDLMDFLINIYEYNRRESIEQLIMQTFGGLKNRAMFTDIIKDHEKWKDFVMKWDLELQGFQAEKFNPELKDATPKELNEFYEKMLSEALRTTLPDYIEEYKKLRELENITYPEIKKVREILQSLKKSDHPVIKLMSEIYETLGII